MAKRPKHSPETESQTFRVPRYPAAPAHCDASGSALGSSRKIAQE